MIFFIAGDEEEAGAPPLVSRGLGSMRPRGEDIPASSLSSLRTPCDTFRL
jgi:hypothetical protein